MKILRHYLLSTNTITNNSFSHQIRVCTYIRFRAANLREGAWSLCCFTVAQKRILVIFQLQTEELINLIITVQAYQKPKLVTELPFFFFGDG